MSHPPRFDSLVSAPAPSGGTVRGFGLRAVQRPGPGGAGGMGAVHLALDLKLGRHWR